MSLTQQQLESMLWGAAEYLRGQIDASDYKQYIFPLLFYKRLSDVYQDEYEDDRGQTKVQNKIPFGGYSPVPGEHENVPF